MLILRLMIAQSLCSDRQRFEFRCHIGNVEPVVALGTSQGKKFKEVGTVANAAKSLSRPL